MTVLGVKYFYNNFHSIILNVPTRNNSNGEYFGIKVI